MTLMDFESGTIGNTVTTGGGITTVTGTCVYATGVRGSVGARLTGATSLLTFANTGSWSGKFYWRPNVDISSSGMRIFVVRSGSAVSKTYLRAEGASNNFEVYDGTTLYASPGTWVQNTVYRFEYQYTDDSTITYRCFVNDNTKYEWEQTCPATNSTAAADFTLGAGGSSSSTDHLFDDVEWESGAVWLGPNVGINYYNGSSEQGVKLTRYNGSSEDPILKLERAP